MNWADERSAIEQRVANGFTDAAVQFSGVPFNAPAAAPWVRVKIASGVTKRVGLGPGGTIRNWGMVIFQVYAPSNQGSQAARAISDTLAALFNEVQFSYNNSGLITCWQAELDDRGESADGAWYQVNLTIPYWRDEPAS